MPVTGTALVAGVLAFFSSLAAYRLSSVSISPSICPAYTKLKPSERREWDSRIPSTIHAALITLASFYALKVSDTFDAERLSKGGENVMFAHSRFTEASVGMSLGYFAHDIVVLGCNWKQMGSPAMMAHHAVAAVSLVAALHTHQGHMYTLLLLATEMTTPFINARWHLDAVATVGLWTALKLAVLGPMAISFLFFVQGMKESTTYMLNAVAILVSWALGRIYLSLRMFWHMLSHRDDVRLIDEPGRSLVVCVPIILFCLNLFWFWKIFRGFVKVVSKKLWHQSTARLDDGAQSGVCNKSPHHEVTSKSGALKQRLRVVGNTHSRFA